MQGEWAYRGYLAMIGGFLVHLTIGSGYTLGNMTPYISSYLRHHGDPNITSPDMVWIFASVFIGKGALMFLAGILESRIGARLTIFIGSMVMTFGVLITHWTITTKFWAVVLSLGIVFGLGDTLCYVTPVICGIKWFPNNKGLVAGCIMAGYGLSSSIFDQVETLFINPSNVKPIKEYGGSYFEDEGVLNRTPWVFILLAGIYFIMQVVGCCLLKSPGQKEVYEIVMDFFGKPKCSSVAGVVDEPDTPQICDITSKESAGYGFDNSLISTNVTWNSEKKIPGYYQYQILSNPSKETQQYQDLSLSQVMKTVPFYILWLTFSFNVASICFLSTMYKTFAFTFLTNDKQLATFGSVASICSCLGRLFWGFCMDRVSYRICMFTTCGISVAFMASIFQTKYHPDNPYMFAAWLWILFFMMGGNYAIFPAACAHMFGPTHVGLIYGVIGSALAGGGLIVGTLSQLLFTEVGGFQWFFYITAILLFCSFVLTLFYNPRGRGITDDLRDISNLPRRLGNRISN